MTRRTTRRVRRGKNKSLAGPILLVIVLLVDIGLIVWAYHRFGRKPEAPVPAEDFSLTQAPVEPVPAPGAAPLPTDRLPPPGSMAFIVKDERLTAGYREIRSKKTGKSKKRSTRRSSKKKRKKVSKAVRYFFKLKRHPRFKKSKVIREWKRDFLSYKDLRRINRRFRKDGDALRFVSSMVRSPNFRKMAKKYIQRPDVQAFVKKMASSRSVLSSAATFMEDPKVEDAMKDFDLGSKGLSAGSAKAMVEEQMRRRKRR